MMNPASQRKPLPSRPSQDLGYGAGYGGQNRYGNENTNPKSYGSAKPKSGRPLEPNGRIILEGYRKDIVNGFEGEKPRYNPVSKSIPETWPSIDIIPAQPITAAEFDAP